MAEDRIPFWSWNKDGDEVSGEIVDIVHLPEHKLKNGNWIKEQDGLDIDGPQGLVRVTTGVAALRDWFAAEHPQVGDFVEIKFAGWEDIKNNEGEVLAHPQDASKPWQKRTFSVALERAGLGTNDLPPTTFGSDPADSLRPPAFDPDDDIPF